MARAIPVQLDDSSSSRHTRGKSVVVVEPHEPRTEGDSMTAYRQRLEAGEYDPEKRDDDEQPVEQPDEQPQEQPDEESDEQPDETSTPTAARRRSTAKRSSTRRKRSTIGAR